MVLRMWWHMIVYMCSIVSVLAGWQYKTDTDRYDTGRWK